jgi:hypothetical protein
MQMTGYYMNAEKTTEAVPDGKYVRTGDVGKIGKDGLLYILGRVKDIIPTYRGFNVAPRDIEEILYTHPAVGEAQVVGMTHPCGAGDMVVAWANAKVGQNITPEQLREHCVSAGLPSWQMPEVFNVSLEKLPTNGGKLNKKALQAPAFVRQTLVNYLKQGEEDDAARMSAQEKESAAQGFHSLAAAVLVASDQLSVENLRPLFEEHTAEFVESFGKASPTATESIGLSCWLASLATLRPERRAAWLLQLGSVLAVYDRVNLSA